MDKRAQWGLGGAVVLVLGAFLGYLLNDIDEDYDFIQKVPTATVATSAGAVPGAATPGSQPPLLVISATPGANVAIAVARIEQGDPAAGGNAAASPAAAAAAAPGELETTGDRWLRFVLWLMLFGGTAGLMILIFRFLSERAEDTNALTERIIARGFVPEIIAVGTFVDRGDIDDGTAFDTETRTPPRVAIKGPRQAIIGVMTPFEIVNEATGQRAEGLSFTWAINRVPPIDPPDRIEPIAAGGGNAANLTGLAKGDITLSVTVEGFPNIVLPAQVTIVDPPRPTPAPRPQVLAYGQGWMSLVLAIVLILALLVLSLEGVLEGAVVAPILRTIAGYIFGTGVQATKQGEQGDGKPGGA
jgi:hypothetical protein